MKSSALAYYHDRQEEMDRDIEDRLHKADDFFSNQIESPVRRKLLAARSVR